MAALPEESTRRTHASDSGAPAWEQPQVTEWRQMLQPLASLRLTVVLFLLAIVIVLVGTLAQVHADIWEVIRDYFRVDFTLLWSSRFPWLNVRELFVWVTPDLFFPPAFFPEFSKTKFDPRLGIWFPKGWAIGAAMMLNLVAAHLVRFKVQATGPRLLTGWGVIALGALLTWGVIVSGSNPDGLQAQPLVSYSTVWWLLQTLLFGGAAIAAYAAITARDQPEQRRLGIVIALLLGGGAVMTFNSDPSSEATMRILYQVLKATFVSSVLLAGCILAFRKRAGIVLLHAGIGLMMFYDVLVGVEHVESQMHIMEGETVWFSRDMREPELAIIDRSGADADVNTVVSARRLKKGERIHDELLPFDIEVIEYESSAVPRSLASFSAGEDIPEKVATKGLGERMVLLPTAKATGAGSGGQIDVPGAYVRLTGRDGADLGVYLLSGHFDLTGLPQTIAVDGKNYDLALRFRRLYNDYSITLNDVQKNDYKGTDRPRDYSSYITLNDPSRETEFDQRVWMNNPMRYGGKTFYQSSYSRLEDGEMTTLQVVDNVGWMTPYVSCMMVVVGMMYHFGLTLLRFLGRRARESQAALTTDSSDESLVVQVPRDLQQISRRDRLGRLTALVVALGAALTWTAAVWPRAEKSDVLHLREFGTLPMWYKGRAMPLDAFARNMLLQLSDYQSYQDAEGKTRPAIEWLLHIMTDDDAARALRIIRVESGDVREAIGLEARPGFKYSIDELFERRAQLIEQAGPASRLPRDQRSLYQRKLVELAHKLILHNFLERTLGPAPRMPADAEGSEGDKMQRMADRAQQYLEAFRFVRKDMQDFANEYGLGPLPLIVPTHLGVADRPDIKIEELKTNWEPLTLADLYGQFYGEFPAPTPPAIEKFQAMVAAFGQRDVNAFNQAVSDYRAFLTPFAGEDVPLKKTRFEAWYNRIAAFNISSWMYVLTGVLACIGWLGWPQIFQRTSFWLTVVVLLVHTAAIIARIYISGRPPVTNLYSSAVFIGWAVVLGGLIIEAMTKLGVGNVVAAIGGFLTLRIAHGLAADGDTFVVLEAVLDTQFWLATHVVCITLGYATTYLAGLFGALFIVLGTVSKGLTPRMARELTRMTYGSICFATFFSFWGTVLGGLWADDSWGRFWGWDPKENGALIIVLWNALVLHARWGNMVRDRGLAVLVVLGNIVVSWSWFGVNELGVGLHSYGFTEGRLRMLLLFGLSQLVLAGFGCVPRSLWLSTRRRTPPPEEVAVA